MLTKKIGTGVRWCCRAEDCDKCFRTRYKMAAHMAGAHSTPHVRKPCEHGTVQGYRCEQRRTGETCSECRRAWRNHKRLERYAKEDQAERNQSVQDLQA